MSAEQVLEASTELPSDIPSGEETIGTATKTQENVNGILASTGREIGKGLGIIIRACRKSGNPNIIQFGRDIEETGDINMKNKYGQTLLILAVRNDSIEIVDLLLNNPEILVNEKDDEHGQTALMWAAKYSNIEIMRRLLDCPEILVNEKDKYNQTALMLAAGHSNIEIVQLLLSRPGILVNEKDDKGKTALIWAILGNCSETAFLLLSRLEILVNEADKNGFTALMWAAEKGCTEIVRVLLYSPRLELSIAKQGEKALELAKNPEIKKLISRKIGENKGSGSFFQFLAF